MKPHNGLWLTLILVGCQPPTPTDTVESLVADPERLKEVQRQCRLDPANMSNSEVCNAASEAFRRRFMGDANADPSPQKR